MEELCVNHSYDPTADLILLVGVREQVCKLSKMGGIDATVYVAMFCKSLSPGRPEQGEYSKGLMNSENKELEKQLPSILSGMLISLPANCL